MTAPINNGDVVLIDSLGQGWISASIVIGARMRYGRKPNTRYCHAAIVYDASYQDPGAVVIVEATAASGVHKAFLSQYESRYTMFPAHVGTEDWKQVREFLDSVLEAHETYGRLTYVGLLIYALTGTKLCLQTAGTATCSGLVCDALTRAGFIWARPPYACTPADIAVDLPRLTSGGPNAPPHRQRRWARSAAATRSP